MDTTEFTGFHPMNGRTSGRVPMRLPALLRGTAYRRDGPGRRWEVWLPASFFRWQPCSCSMPAQLPWACWRQKACCPPPSALGSTLRPEPVALAGGVRRDVPRGQPRRVCGGGCPWRLPGGGGMTPGRTRDCFQPQGFCRLGQKKPWSTGRVGTMGTSCLAWVPRARLRSSRPRISGLCGSTKASPTPSRTSAAGRCL